VILRPFFDRPLWKDPLWWIGIVGGLLGGIIYGLRADLGPGDFAWQLVTSMFFFTWWVGGLLLSTIRFDYRRRRASRSTHQASEVSSSGPT
jgi:predicted lipid-binding transport protein (Tim44 family)